jgi:hypothetical protein
MSEHCNHNGCYADRRPKGHVESRATVDYQKREVLAKVLKSWQENSKLRLGQLIVNAMSDQENVLTDLFNIEDYVLVKALNDFSRKNNGPIYPQITIQITK